MIRLKNSTRGSFVPVRDGEKVFFGGHQNWLREAGVSKFFVDRSCVVTAFTNCYLYLYKGGESFTKEEYNSYQTRFYRILRPSVNGIGTSGSLDRRLNYLRKNYHLPLKSHSLSLYPGTGLPLKAVADFIGDGLLLDSPVIVFNRYSPKVKFMTHHAATITQIEETDDYRHSLLLSSWGREYRIFLEDLLEQKRTYTSFIYFSR